MKLECITQTCLLSLISTPNISLEEEAVLLSDRFLPKNYKQLIASHTKLVVKEALQHRYYTSIILDDLIQEGLLGLMHAIEKFNSTHGSRFCTYARWWARAFIQEHIIMYLYTVKNQKKRTELLAQYGKTQRVIHINTDPSDLYGLDSTFVYNFAAGHNLIFEKFADPTQDVEATGMDNALMKKRKQWLALAMKELSPMEIYVIKKVFMGSEPIGIAVIAEELGISSTKVKTVLIKALRKLKSILVKRTHKLQRYF